MDIYSAKRPDGTLTIMVINMTDSRERMSRCRYEGMYPKQAEVWLFDATHNAEDLGQQVMSADGRVVFASAVDHAVWYWEIRRTYETENIMHNLEREITN